MALAAHRRPGSHRPRRVPHRHRPQERPDHQRGWQEHVPTAIEGAIAAGSPLIAQVVAVGGRRPYNTALDPDTTADFAARNGIDNPEPAVLSDHPAVRTAITTAIEQGRARLSRAEQIKRHAITAKYASLIDSLHTTAG